jgi:hypothetical protein
MERRNLIDHAQAALQGPAPEDLAEDALDLFMVLVVARWGALFACLPGTHGGLTLVASRSLDQQALDLARHEWQRASEAVRNGAPTYQQRGERALLMLPCSDATEVMGLLYVEVDGASRRMPAADLATFAGILGRALRASAAGSIALARELLGDGLTTPDAERENLILLLERNEWNVSRVARLLGVTRMTVYNRLRRLNVERQHVQRILRHSVG